MIKSIIEQLRLCIPEMNGEVYGVSDLEQFLGEITENVPTLYVSLFSENSTVVDRKQIIEIQHDVKIFAVFPIPLSDYRGEATQDCLSSFRNRLLHCLWGFKPLVDNQCPAYKNGGLSFVDSQLVKRHNNHLIQVYSFSVIEQISKSQILSQFCEPLDLNIHISPSKQCHNKNSFIQDEPLVFQKCDELSSRKE